MSKLVFGVGVNDAGYQVSKRGEPLCPFYRKWKDMLMRCYSEKYQIDKPTYVGCSVCDEWLTFSNFKSWMEVQDWEDKDLDKDLLILGNKVYSPETCVLVSRRFNMFLTCDRGGAYLPGVTFYKRTGRYYSQTSINGVIVSLGYFDTEEEASDAWFSSKLEQSQILVDSESDPRITLEVVKAYLEYAKYRRKRKHKKGEHE